MPTPTERVESIVRSLEERGQRAAPVEEAIELGRTHPDAVLHLITAVIARFPQGGTFFDAALSYLPEEHWNDAILLALRRLEQGEELEAVEAIFAYASLQALPALHPHLKDIFRLCPNAGTYYENWPWRDLETTDLVAWCHFIENSAFDDDSRPKAWLTLLETRHPDMLAYAVALAKLAGLSGLSPPAEDAVDSYRHQVGYALSEGQLVRQCPEALYHLIFPADFFEGQSRPPWLQRLHPTWNLERAIRGPEALFGGSSKGNCSACHGTLHRLLRLAPVPEGLGVTELEVLELVVCLTCLGWERPTLFYQHSRDRPPEEIGYTGPKLEPEYPACPLREARVQLAQTPPRWKWQDWALSNGRENLNRIGGEPSWIQSADYPRCPTCQQLMKFLFQLDSDLPTADGGEWLWGSGGSGYGFWCDDCKISGFLTQCT